MLEVLCPNYKTGPKQLITRCTSASRQLSGNEEKTKLEDFDSKKID